MVDANDKLKRENEKQSNTIRRLQEEVAKLQREQPKSEQSTKDRR